MGRVDGSSLLARSLVSLLVVAGVAISWACATQFSKSALDLDPDKFYAPYSMVWFGTCFMIICYPVYLLYIVTSGKESLREAHEEALEVFGARTFNIFGFIVRVIPFLILWIGANYCYSQGLGHISASAASAIMSSNVAMVCVLSWVLLKDKVDPLKVIAVFAAIGGVIVISLDDEYAGNLLGVLLVIASAAFAAFYKVMFKKLIGDANLGQVSIFMSGLGLLNILLNIVPTVIMVWLKADRIDWNYVPWWTLAGSAALSLLFNFLVNFGIALLNPLLISIGMLCGIPVSAIIDIFFRDLDPTLKFILGAILILVSFVLCAFPIQEIFQKLRKNSKTSYNVTDSVVP
ncbi:hypothetical protein FO519_001736 [Halicephalobus sp. NKZ332]|nr:hypothetical protein FO519_001736 [Halicephalobus sp. NKZ332]